MCRAIVWLLLLCAWTPVTAKVYKWVLPDGTVQFSDRPQEGAEEVELPGLQTYPAPPVPARDATSPPEKAPSKGYEEVAIASPKSGETLRDNGGTVSIRVSLKPPLQSGHEVEILLDGKSIGSGAGTSASVTNVDRGTHTVSAAVKDAQGATVATAPAVSFHLQRVSATGRVPTPRGGAGGS